MLPFPLPFMSFSIVCFRAVGSLQGGEMRGPLTGLVMRREDKAITGAEAVKIAEGFLLFMGERDWKIANPVAIAVAKAERIDLIDRCPAPPWRLLVVAHARPLIIHHAGGLWWPIRWG
jgi:hypothetical protein